MDVEKDTDSKRVNGYNGLLDGSSCHCRLVGDGWAKIKDLF